MKISNYIQLLLIAGSFIYSTASIASSPGKALYASYCAQCHKDNGGGIKAAGFPSLRDSKMVKTDRAATYNIIAKGSPKNPVMGSYEWVGPRALNDITDYVVTVIAKAGLNSDGTKMSAKQLAESDRKSALAQKRRDAKRKAENKQKRQSYFNSIKKSNDPWFIVQMAEKAEELGFKRVAIFGYKKVVNNHFLTDGARNRALINLRKLGIKMNIR